MASAEYASSSLLPPFDPASTANTFGTSSMILPTPPTSPSTSTPTPTKSGNFFTRARSNSVHSSSSSARRVASSSSSDAPPPPLPAFPMGLATPPSSSPSAQSSFRFPPPSTQEVRQKPSLQSLRSIRPQPSRERLSPLSQTALHQPYAPNPEQDLDATSSLTATPIRSVAVTHHCKSPSGKVVFACRVMPQPILSILSASSLTTSADSSKRSSTASGVTALSMSRQGSLGPMEIAGLGQGGMSEPYTVMRSYGEFVDFSNRLATIFPEVPHSPTSPRSPMSTDSLPSSFYRQTPRLPKKITLFVTRSTLDQRQNDLDMFVRRLFEMPQAVSQSATVRSFFCMGERDVQAAPTGGAAAAAAKHRRGGSAESTTSSVGGNSLPPSPEAEPESFARFLSDMASPNATIRASTSKAMASSSHQPPRRPSLNVKQSTPNLRGSSSDRDTDSLLDFPLTMKPSSRAAVKASSAFARPAIPQRFEFEANNPRNSKYSMTSASSTSSSATVTPASMANKSSAASLRGWPTSPLSGSERPSLASLQFDFPSTSPVAVVGGGEEATPVTPKRPKQFLRHFLSLQDLRRPSLTTPDVPSPALPLLSSFGSKSLATSSPMGRAVTQPVPQAFSPTRAPARPTMEHMASVSGTSMPSYHAALGGQRQRSGSKSSSTSSFEDYGHPVLGPYSTAQAHAHNNGGFRHGPTGRLDRVSDSTSSSAHGRRPSMPRTSSLSKGTGHHSPSPSTSSIASSRSSAAGSSDMSRSFSSPDYRSRGSSTTDFSEGSFGPMTPPSSTLHNFEDLMGGKYFVKDGALTQNNMVPLPPFFPVPPSMSSVAMAVAHSHDGLPVSPRHTHSRRPSTESRSHSRHASLSSVHRSNLDTILASPSSTPGTPSSLMSSTCSSIGSPSLSSVRPQDRPTITFKVLHTDNNLILRVPRAGLTLEVLRHQIERKFALSCGLKLYGDDGKGQWVLSYNTGKVGAAGTVHADILLNARDFELALERTAHLEKVALRIVCA